MSKSQNTQNGGADQFALIATAQPTDRTAGLVEIHPPELAEIILPVGPAAGRELFTPLPSRDNPDAVREELQALKQKFTPFMQRLAPPLPVERPTMPLEAFSWKIGGDADRSNFAAVLAGAGDWETVSIPHYGAPLGRAVTYYRREFQIPSDFTARGAVFLCFKGVDYKAHVFVNDDYRGSHEGFFAPFEFEITSALRPGTNVLLVKVENDAIQMGNKDWSASDELGDKVYAATGPGYDDPAVGWHHCPPGMGIYQAVWIEARAPQHFHDLFIRPRREEGLLDLTFEVWNCSRENVPVAISFSIYGRNFEATVCEDQKLENMNPAAAWVNFYRVTVKAEGLRDWEPDTPWLYELHAELRDANGHLLDAVSRHFGVRSFWMDEGSTPKGRLYLNGREIRLRGANTMGHEQQCVMRGNFGQLIDDILLAKVCNMNFLRLTQRPVQSEVYEYCDMLGLMVQTDLPLFGVLRRNLVSETIRQAGEMERLVRNSPANILVSYINEPFPNARKNPERFLQRDELQMFFEAADRVVRLENPDRVIKHVDGDYDPPCDSLPDNHCYNIWYNGHGLDLGKLHKGYWLKIKPGWMCACGEFGAEGLEDESLMRARYPHEWLPWTPEEEQTWSPSSIVRAQSGRFHYVWFETRRKLADWIQASQTHQAWGVRLMTEAFRRENRFNSFAIHLFIDAFPSGWMKTIMDCERRPKQAFYAYRDACAPLMISLRSDRDRFFAGEEMPLEIWVCNDTHDAHSGAQLVWRLLLNGEVLEGGSSTAVIVPMSSQFQGIATFHAPLVEKMTDVVVEAALVDLEGATIWSTRLPLQIYPTLPVPEGLRVCVLGETGGKADRLAAALDLPRTDQLPESDVIFCDDLTLYAANEEEIGRAVRRGARCLFLGIQPGTHRLAEEEITFTKCNMNAVHFANRDTGHPIVEGLGPDSVKFWFDEDLAYVSPFLRTTFQTEGWEAILRSGNGFWSTEWEPVLAAASKTEGHGQWIICQLDLHNRTKTNPIASLLARRMVGSRASLM
ncbi:MAG: glycosyl hydrolase 2 galactose-binding domain-containing protein [Spartobacteria bacterium]